MKKVFLWKPAKVERIAYGFLGSGGVVTEWQWLTTVVDVDGKLFDKDASALIAGEVQRNASIKALEYMNKIWAQSEKPHYKYNWKTGKAELVG